MKILRSQNENCQNPFLDLRQTNIKNKDNILNQSNVSQSSGEEISELSIDKKK